jgi:glyoxylase-like metal-dependent hydrolase (beta-lactamase superfamily II)
MAQDRLYFRQLLSGRDIAVTDMMAKQMVNFIYLIGDRETGEAVVVDPAYDPQGIVDVAEADGMRITGALATHHHVDHVGGSMMGFGVPGLAELLDIVQVPVHVQADEAEFVQKTTGVEAGDMVSHSSGDRLEVGAIGIELIHTPGHTPGSQCFYVDECLVAGDTLFLDGCGRTDLPGGDPLEIYYSITQRLARIPDQAVLFPGHLYSPQPSASMGDTREHNYVFTPKSPEQWMAMFGH